MHDELRVAVSGSGPLILCIHGGSSKLTGDAAAVIDALGLKGL